MVRPNNPQSIRTAVDLAEPLVTLVNREEGSGARLLLDQRLKASGVEPTHVQGYDRIVSSHFNVARAVAERRADVGVGIRSAAQLFELDFIPLQAAPMTSSCLNPIAHPIRHSTLAHLFDTLISRHFRDEIEALGGYDTSETGKVHALRVS